MSDGRLKLSRRWNIQGLAPQRCQRIAALISATLTATGLALFYPASAQVPHGVIADKKLVFSEPFTSLNIPKKWGWQTGAYEFCRTNPKYDKRDYLTTTSMSVANGVLTTTATRRDAYYWNTGLLTTGDSCSTGGNEFTLQAGDFYVARVKLPTGNTGAWPGLWTWRNGDTEVDVLEWHSDNPHILEFSNHIREAGYYYEDADFAAPGNWVLVGVHLGENENVWYVGHTLSRMRSIWNDSQGIGKAQPYLILNLSVGSSPLHAGPIGDEPVVFQTDYVRVYR